MVFLPSSSGDGSLDRLLQPVSTGLSPRKRTTSQCKSEPPLLRTSKRTIYTAGRPPWYNEHGTQSKEAFAIGETDGKIPLQGEICPLVRNSTRQHAACRKNSQKTLGVRLLGGVSWQRKQCPHRWGSLNEASVCTIERNSKDAALVSACHRAWRRAGPQGESSRRWRCSHQRHFLIALHSTIAPLLHIHPLLRLMWRQRFREDDCGQENNRSSGCPLGGPAVHGLLLQGAYLQHPCAFSSVYWCYLSLVPRHLFASSVQKVMFHEMFAHFSTRERENQWE